MKSVQSAASTEMKPVSSLLFLFAISSVRSEVVDLNDLVDKNIFRVNDYLRQQKLHSFSLGGDPRLSDKVSFEQVFIMGLDQFQRTGDCNLIKDGNNYTYELNIGSSFLVMAVPSFVLKDETMVAVFRVKNNSLNMSFSQIKGEDGSWNATLIDLTIKSLGQVEFKSSDPKHDGTDVDDIFENIRTNINELIGKLKFELGTVVTELWYRVSKKYPNGIFDEL